MTKTEVSEYFGTPYRAAQALGITSQSYYAWPEQISELRQCHIECFTNGRLKADIVREPKRKNK